MINKTYLSFITLIIVFFITPIKALEKCESYCTINKVEFSEQSILNSTIEKFQEKLKTRKKSILITNNNDYNFYDDNGSKIGYYKKTNDNEKMEITSIKYLFQNQDKYKKYDCPDNGAFLIDDFKHHGCMVFNFAMYNNAVNTKKTDIVKLYNQGYRCHFDYKKAKQEYGYNDYQLIDISKKYTNDINYKYPNKNNIVRNGKDTFTLKDIIKYNHSPIMVWLIPNKDTKLDKGHLITIYKYQKKNNKEQFYFYDTFNNKTPSRNLNEFMERWKIVQLHLYN